MKRGGVKKITDYLKPSGHKIGQSNISKSKGQLTSTVFKRFPNHLVNISETDQKNIQKGIEQIDVEFSEKKKYQNPFHILPTNTHSEKYIPSTN